MYSLILLIFKATYIMTQLAIQLYMHSYMGWYCPLGYAQGMSDMLGPILYVVDDEVDAFWCFVGLMERMVSIN